MEQFKPPHIKKQVSCRNITDLLMAEKITGHHIAFIVTELHEVMTKYKKVLVDFPAK